MSALGLVGADIQVRTADVPVFVEFGVYGRPIRLVDDERWLVVPTLALGVTAHAGAGRFKNGAFIESGLTLSSFREVSLLTGWSGRLFTGQGSRFAFDFEVGPGFYILRRYPNPYDAPAGVFTIHARIGFHLFPTAPKGPKPP